MTDSLLCREALVTEAPLLSELAYRSKAYWGYSTDFMNACREELSVPAQIIEDDRYQVIVAVDQRDIVGFYVLDGFTGGQVELDALFVEPTHIGKGVGKTLMELAKHHASQLGAGKLIIQGDPHALSFYQAAGAVVVGELESGSIPGRFLPLLEIPLSAANPPDPVQDRSDSPQAGGV